jgi:hypothetical protein
MSLNLQYNYAIILIETGFCGACFTTSDELLDPTAIPVPYADDNYVGKYYNINGDQMWYWDAEFTQLWEECPSHNI